MRLAKEIALPSDTTPPTLNLPPAITATATGPTGAMVTYTASATDDVDGEVIPTCTPPSGSLFPIGDTTVDCTATDQAGNTATDSFIVTVLDTTAPTLTVPGNLTIEATSPAGAVVTYTASATDDVDGPITPTCTPASGNTFPIGATSVNCSATNAAGSTATDSFIVTILDTTPPALTVPGNLTMEAAGPAGAAVTYTASAIDLVDGAVIPSCTPASGSTFGLGTTTVNCSATDQANNTATGSFTVTVLSGSASIGDVLTISSSYEFSLEQSTQKGVSVQVFNPGGTPRTATLAIVNPHAGLTLSLPNPGPITVAPGATETLSLNINATSAPIGVYQGILLEVAVDNGSTLYSNLTVYVTNAGAANLPDLTVNAGDLTQTSANPGEATLTAVIRNRGNTPASGVTVQFREFGTLLGETVVPVVSANGSIEASITLPTSVSGDRYVAVTIDPMEAVQELDKNNNQASRILPPPGGTPSPTEGSILVTGNLPKPVCAGASFNVTGQAVYDILVNGIRSRDYVVKGGSVQLTVGGAGSAGSAYGDIYTDVNGYFARFLRAPSAAGNYSISMTVSDNTFSGTGQFVFTVEECVGDFPSTGPSPLSCPPYCPNGDTGPSTVNFWQLVDALKGLWKWICPSGFPCPSVPEQDVFVRSRDIYFYNDHPAPNEEVRIFTEIQYSATNTAIQAQQVPVNFYVTAPGSLKVKLLQSVIDSMKVGGSVAFATWKAAANGIYLVEVEIDPSYLESNIWNNAATRALIVGEIASGQGVVSGQVTNASGGVGNVQVNAYDAAGGLLGSSLTNPTGFYLIENAPMGETQVQIEAPAGYQPDAAMKTAAVADQTVSAVDFYLAAAVTPSDTTPPTLNLSAIPAEATGPAGAVVNYAASAMDDVDGAITPTCTPASGSTFPLGATTVNCSATDAAGNTATGGFLVTVRDTTPPTLVCPSNLTITQGQSLNLGTPTVSDNVDAAPQVVNNAPASFPLGTTPVTWTATDASGNQATCTQQVIIEAASIPNQPPIANAGSDQVVRQGSLVTLSGSGSDPDNGPDPLTFVWSGSVALQGANTVTPTFTAAASGIYTFALVVNDGADSSPSDSVQITVPALGEIDRDGDIDNDDLAVILAARNTPASGPNDLRDLNGDGKIDALDTRKLVLLCTRPRCATQ